MTNRRSTGAIPPAGVHNTEKATKQAEITPVSDYMRNCTRRKGKAAKIDKNVQITGAVLLVLWAGGHVVRTAVEAEPVGLTLFAILQLLSLALLAALIDS